MLASTPSRGAVATVPMPSLPGVTHRFIDLPGLRMHVAEAGSGPAVLLLHGFPQHWWEWRAVLPRLAPHCRVVVPDLRGAGWTDAPATGYAAPQLVADLVGLLDALGIETVDLVGHDIGGILSYRFCLAHPERGGRFVAVAAPHPYPRFEARILLHLWRLWPMFAVAAPVLGARLLGRGRQRVPRRWFSGDTGEREVWTERDVELYLAPLRVPGRSRAASALHRSLMVGENRVSSAGRYRGTRLRTPTLSLYGAVLYGGADLAPGQHPALLEGFEDHADDLTLEHVPGTGFYLVDERPDVVADRALRFFGLGSPDGPTRVDGQAPPVASEA